MQRISIARIVNGTRLIYAWDSLSLREEETEEETEERARVAESERQPAKGREASRIWLNIIFSARGNFHFFVRRLPPLPPPSPPFQEGGCEIRRKGGRNPTRFRFYVNVRPWQTQRVASLVLSFVKPVTQHPIRLSLSLSRVPSFYP